MRDMTHAEAVGYAYMARQEAARQRETFPKVAQEYDRLAASYDQAAAQIASQVRP